MESQTGTATILWRGRYLIVASLIVGLVTAILVTAASSKVYESTAVIQVESSLATGGAAVLDQQQASQGLATTYSTLIGSESFLSRIRRLVAGGRYTVSDLETRISASPVTHDTQNTNLIKLTAHGSSPTRARTLAGQVAQAFVKTIEKDAAARTTVQQNQLQLRIKDITQQIGDLASSSGSSPSGAEVEQLASLRAARTALTAELANIVASGVSREGAVSVVGPPTYQGSAVSPRPTLNYLAGIVLGLLAGLGLAWLRNFLDRNIHSSDEVQALIGAPVLASIPLHRSAEAADRATREAYDLLHTNLSFASPDAMPEVVTITSQQAGEGKTATVEGLAAAAARRRVKVVVVDADLRRRSLSTQLRLQSGKGLTNLIAGGGRGSDEDSLDADAEELLQQLSNGVFVLPAGPSPPDPPTVIGSVRMRSVIDQLRSRFDLVLIDAPPVPHLADATLLAALADATLLVVRTDLTEKKNLVEAREALKRTGTPLLGAAVFERLSFDELYYYSGEEKEKRGFRSRLSEAVQRRTDRGERPTPPPRPKPKQKQKQKRARPRVKPSRPATPRPAAAAAERLSRFSPRPPVTPPSSEPTTAPEAGASPGAGEPEAPQTDVSLPVPRQIHASRERPA